MPSSVDPFVAKGCRHTMGASQSSSSVCRLTRRETMAFACVPWSVLKFSSKHKSEFSPIAAFPDPQLLEAPELIVAGPDNGPLTPWADIIHTVIDRLSPNGEKLRARNVGGTDGVTAANQFDARIAPDGSTVMLISGEPAIAWLVGDSRAQFDAGHWLPLVTGLVSGVVLSRTTARTHAGAVRLAVASTPDLALAARLGLSLLGIEITKIVPASDPVAALRSGEAEFAFLRGAEALRPVRAIDANIVKAVFSLGVIDEAGNLVRDPQLPQIPHLPELARNMPRTPDFTSLLAAWRATAAAAQLDFALVLPWLSPAGTVAWWRKAATQIAAQIRSAGMSASKSSAPQYSDIEICAEPTSSFGLAAIPIDATTSLALRRWLVSRQI